MTRAIAFTEFGSADVLHPVEIDLPAPGPGQVRIAVRAAGVNPVDHKIRSGGLAELFPVVFPHVPGFEAAGVVEAVGEGVDAVAVGGEVVGPTVGGAYAEHALLDAARLVTRPAELGWEQAAGLPVATETAWRALDLLDLLGPGEGRTLLLHGAAGGVGTLVSQFARARGLRVIGTASEANHAYLRELGVIPVAYGDGLADRVRALAPEGVDAALDAAGRDGAVAVSIELTGGTDRVLTIADAAGAQELGVRFTAGGDGPDHSRTALAAALALHAAGTLVLPVHEAHPLGDAARAQLASEHGHLRGKIVLTVG